jgi:hypothetical protein
VVPLAEQEHLRENTRVCRLEEGDCVRLWATPHDHRLVVGLLPEKAPQTLPAGLAEPLNSTF